jgi:glycosyltransferase involved in cell wall biosynthesis
VYPLLFKLYTTGHPVGRSAGQYLARFGFKAESQFRFPYGIDNRWFAVESAKNRMDGPANRASWGLPLHGPVVCGVMKFSDREDPLTLVRAFKQAKKTLPSLNLLLIGDGPLRGLVEKEAGSYLKESIVLSGYQKYDMLPSAYAATDLFVHTASGAWEVSVNEALACGLPVVASDAVGSAEELVLDNRLGATFRHGDADDLSEKIASALTDQALLNRARSIGFACLAEWDYPATAERLVSALNYARGKRRFSRIADQSA